MYICKYIYYRIEGLIIDKVQKTASFSAYLLKHNKNTSKSKI